jgi:hypothetical protein
MSKLLHGEGIDLMCDDLTRDENLPRYRRSPENFFSCERNWSEKE